MQQHSIPAYPARSVRLRVWALLTVILLVAGSGTKAAKFAGEAYSLGAGARGQALGRAMIAAPSDGFSAYWNPAALSLVTERQLSAMHAETFGELLNHDVLAYAQPSSDSGSKFALGGYLYYLGGGGIKITELNGSGRPEVVREESHADILVSGALAKKASRKLALGGTVKFIYRDLGTESGLGLTADLGALYQANDWLTLGLVISDATSGFIRYAGGSKISTSDTTSVESEARAEAISPAVHPGLRLTKSYRDWTAHLLASGEIRAEDLKQSAQYWQGVFSLDTQYGLELWYQSLAAGRVGFDNGRLTVGAGIQYQSLNLDLAYLHHDAFDGTYRISAGYRF